MRSIPWSLEHKVLFRRSLKHELAGAGVGVVLVVILLMLSACKTLLPAPLLTTTEQGVPVEQVAPQQTMDRDNVPVGVDPDDVVAHVQDKSSGEEIWVVKEPFKKAKVFHKPMKSSASSAVKNELAVDVAERSWAWAWWTGGVLAALIAIDRLLKSFLGMNPFGAVFGFIKRLFKRS